jgi:hypothetical protein
MIIRKFGVYAATNVDDWSSVLDLASKWKFESIKALAIERLAALASPIDKIVLGRRHEITEWLVDAYTAVCERSSALTLEEAKRLGLDDVVKISFLRQEIRTSAFRLARASVDVVSTTFGLDENQREVSPVESGDEQVEQVMLTPDERHLTPVGWPPTPINPNPLVPVGWSPTLRLEESPFSFEVPGEAEGLPSSADIGVGEEKVDEGAQKSSYFPSKKSSTRGRKRGK